MRKIIEASRQRAACKSSGSWHLGFWCSELAIPGVPLPTASPSLSGAGNGRSAISDIFKFSFPFNAGTDGEIVRIDVESFGLSADS